MTIQFNNTTVKNMHDRQSWLGGARVNDEHVHVKNITAPAHMFMSFQIKNTNKHDSTIAVGTVKESTLNVSNVKSKSKYPYRNKHNVSLTVSLALAVKQWLREKTNEKGTYTHRLSNADDSMQRC